LKSLVDGVKHFQTIFAEDRQFYVDLAKGQTPQALFITCSDSRVNPNLITNTKPGELFILRNAGNIVPPWRAVKGGEACTIEYAIQALGVKEIIICGHSQCGAMKAILHPPSRDEMPAVCDWLDHAETTRKIMAENYQHLHQKDGSISQALLNATVQENVLVQLEALQTHPAVATRLARDDIRLHAWFYKLETGEVYSFDPKEGQYKKFTDMKGEFASAVTSTKRHQRAFSE
jgi:carbonic anhydrase